MKTPLLNDGDLVVGTNNDLAMATGLTKVQQDVTGALVEPLGNDRFHPGWGSDLEAYIGMPILADVSQTVLTEVNRVVGNYAAVQRDKVESQSLSGDETTWNTDEIVAGVTKVTTQQAYDTINVEITLGTVAGETTTITQTGV